MITSADPKDQPPMFDVERMIEYNIRPRPALILWMIRHGIADTADLKKEFDSSRPAMHAEYKLLEERELIVKFPNSFPTTKCSHTLQLTENGEAVLDELTHANKTVKL